MFWSLLFKGRYEEPGMLVWRMDKTQQKSFRGYDLANVASMIDSGQYEAVTISESDDAEVYVEVFRIRGELKFLVNVTDQSTFEQRFAELLPHLSSELEPLTWSARFQYDIHSKSPRELVLEDLDVLVEVLFADRSKLSTYGQVS